MDLVNPARLAWPPEQERAWGRAGVQRPRVDASRTLPGERSSDTGRLEPRAGG